MQKARALQAQRSGIPNMPGLSSLGMQPGGMGPGHGSPISGSASSMGPMGGMHMGMGGGFAGGVPGNLRMPPGMSRPLPGNFPKSAPVVPHVATAKKAPSLSERRAMKLGNLGSSTPGSGTATPKLSDLNGGANQKAAINGEGRGSKLSDFNKYIDAEKGWITFEGAATITRTGVNFANGKTFSISLDETEVMDELGKGNYGTVYKVRHSRAKVPRFGQGLSQFRTNSRQPSGSEKDGSVSEASPLSPPPSSNTSGVVMAMKELRLELDEAKFATILKELVILHECVSPYIIDFYGAFYQEGAVYMCIEYMDGGSIDKLYAGGIPEPVLRKITYSTIMGLKALKDDHNIIHRDVKPTNILANSRGQIKICDFGVSGNLVASIAKTNIGCQSYMAPERISGGGMSAVGGGAAGTYSVQSDIWSLGLTIIECAMGKYPYPAEVSSTIFSQLSVSLQSHFPSPRPSPRPPPLVSPAADPPSVKAIVEGDPPDLPSEGYSAVARDFVKSCLNKNPTKRHTYPMLLQHPWINPLTHPNTIPEDAEAEDAAADDSLADATGALSLDGGDDGDEEVAQWVRGVLEKKAKGQLAASAQKPALHTAPLDQLSPLSSPKLE